MLIKLFASSLHTPVNWRRKTGGNNVWVCLQTIKLRNHLDYFQLAATGFFSTVMHEGNYFSDLVNKYASFISEGDKTTATKIEEYRRQDRRIVMHLQSLQHTGVLQSASKSCYLLTVPDKNI